MSLIQCSSDCRYQKDGYCALEKAAQITAASKTGAGGCLHYLPRNNEDAENIGQRPVS